MHTSIYAGVENVLDKEALIELDLGSNALFDIFYKAIGSFPVNISSIGEPVVDAIIPEDSPKKIENLVERYGAYRVGRSFVVRQTIKAELFKQIVELRGEIKSLIGYGSFFDAGHIRLFVRFHSSELDKFTRILGRVLESEDLSKILSIVYLRDSPGVFSILDELNRISRLYVVTYRINKDLPSHKHYGVGSKFEMPLSIREQNNTFKTIVYRKAERAEAAYEYSVEYVNDPFLNNISSELDGNNILRIVAFGSVGSGSIVTSTFLLESQVDGFLRSLYSVAKNTHTEGLILTGVYPYDEMRKRQNALSTWKKI